MKSICDGKKILADQDPHKKTTALKNGSLLSVP